MPRLKRLLPLTALFSIGLVTVSLADPMIAMRKIPVYRSLLDYTTVATLAKGQSVNVLFCVPNGNLCKIENPAGYARNTYLRPYTGIKPPCLDLIVVNC